MGGEERFRAHLIVQVLHNGPRQREAVKGARAAPDFIQHNQAARGGVVENVRGLGHLNHEGGLPTRQIIAGANAGEDAVHEVNACFRRRHKAAGVREQGEQRHLPDVRGLARHVRPGDERDLRQVRAGFGSLAGTTGQRGVIGYKAFVGELLFEHGMPAVADLQATRIADQRFDEIIEPRGFGKRTKDIQLGERGRCLLDLFQLTEHSFAHALEEFILQLHAAFLGAENLALHVLQLGGDETFTVGNRLLADVMRRHLVQIGPGDLDVITEHRIEPHFE